MCRGPFSHTHRRVCQSVRQSAEATFRIWVAFAITACAACGGQSPTRPSAPTGINVGFPGNWAGTLTDAQVGSGTISLKLMGYVPDKASGSITFSISDVTRSGSGSVLDGTSNFSCGPVGGAVGTLSVSGDTLIGSLSLLDCAPFTKVTIQAQRQPQ